MTQTQSETQAATPNIQPSFEAVVDIEAGTGNIIGWNHEAEALFDWSQSEVLGRSFFDTLIPREVRDSLSDNVRNLAQSGESSDFTETVETRALCRDGHSIPVELRFRPLKKGSLSIAALDISVRKRKELAQIGQDRVFEMLASRGALTEILTALIQVIEIRFDVRASVLLVDAEGKKLHPGSAPSLPAAFTQACDGLEIGPCSGSCGTAAYRCDTVIIEDIKTDPLWAGFRDLGLQSGIRSCWSKPIMSREGKVLGTMCMYYRDPRQPLAEEQALMVTCAKLASIAIESRNAMTELENKMREVEFFREEIASKEERIRTLKDEIKELKRNGHAEGDEVRPRDLH